MTAKRGAASLLIGVSGAAALAAAAADSVALLTVAEVEAAMKGKVTQTIPGSVGSESGCVFKLGRDQVTLSFFTNPKDAPNAKGIKDDPFMRGLSEPAVRDYGNVGCKTTNFAGLFSTNCNRYQPRWLHISLQTRGKDAIPMDAGRDLLEKAAARLK